MPKLTPSPAPPTITPARIKHLKIEDKRFHVPFVVESSCPTCGKRRSIDLTREYLAYPTIGKPEEVYFICDNGHDDVEWQVEVIIHVTLTLAEPKH